MQLHISDEARHFHDTSTRRRLWRSMEIAAGKPTVSHTPVMCRQN